MNKSFTPLFFTGRNGPLYGVHHAPVSGDSCADLSHAVLFLPPLGQDYKRCHKTSRRLASDLARAGFHVLRFDYAGSGDSANVDDWSLESWREDAQDALAQLQELSGARRLSVFAVRLGAAVATRLDCPLANLVLWDPIGDGRAYLEELETLNLELLRTFSHSHRRGRKTGIPRNQLVGHVITDSMRDSLAAYRFEVQEPGKPARALWIDAEATSSTANFNDHAGRLARTERYCEVKAGCNWRSLADIGDVIMGQPIGRQVLLHFKEEAGGHGNST